MSRDTIVTKKKYTELSRLSDLSQTTGIEIDKENLKYYEWSNICIELSKSNVTIQHLFAAELFSQAGQQLKNVTLKT